MRRFVVLDGTGKVAEGVEFTDGRAFVAPDDGQLPTFFLDMDGVADGYREHDIRFLDYHTADEAYKLATE